ncbi:actin-like ATPase domain-containing protein [Daedaleopsis nitida]|nr:actin-like ATPase domain-containing protein [Daedaleopsis nitida]
MDVDEQHLSYLPMQPLPAVHVPATDYDDHREQHTPLCIDNGSTHLRFGFCTSDSPRTGINMVAKYKERRTNKPLLLFGEGIDIEGGARSQAKTPWEGDVLLNFDALENALDYAFIHLGIDTPTVDHPILMTERLASPLHSRALTSELMFEQYNVPSLAFCVDSAMSFYHNNLPSPRINWGTMQATDYLLKLIQLKYPTFPSRLTTTQCNWMLQSYCEFSPDYTALLRKLKDPLNLRASERIIQFPYTLPVTEEKTEEELARIAERKKEQGRKLQELAAKSRMEKLLQKETDLAHLLSVRERRDEETKKEWAETLKEEGLANDAALDSIIKKLEADLKKEEVPTFPLVDVLDEDLDEDGLKEKKKQKLLKAGYEARERAKREKEREREERAAEEKRDEQERDRDLSGWASKLRREQEVIMTRIKERNRRKAALTDRKSAASQARMKSIANLAADDRLPKKRRKAGGGECAVNVVVPAHADTEELTRGADDMFGADDADWAIYRKINTSAVSSDEEDDLANLQAVEQKLLAYDPTFTEEHTHASLTSQRSALMSAFRPQYEEGDVQGKARIHLNVERWRVCEAWFSPSMAGVDSAGLGEVLQNILARFPDADKARLVRNVFLTGAPAQIPGLADRVHATLRPILPPETALGIVRAADPVLDAWRGMADFARTDEFARVGVTRAEYDEWGGERIKRWWGGNWNASVPI